MRTLGAGLRSLPEPVSASGSARVVAKVDLIRFFPVC